MFLFNSIKRLSTMEAVLEKDLTDIISMSRPYVREPNPIRKLEAG